MPVEEVSKKDLPGELRKKIKRGDKILYRRKHGKVEEVEIK